MNDIQLLIKNAEVVDHNQSLKCDVLIKDGIIQEVGQNLKMDCKIVDAKGLILMPAFTDLHAHFRDPGYTYKEDIESGSQAAVKGGYTTVNLMANTNPVCSNDDTIAYVVKKAAEKGLIDVFQTCSVTRDFDGQDCSHLKKIKNKQVKIISDDGFGVESYEVMEKALNIAKKKGLIVSSHAEYRAISETDARESENLMTKRDLELCEKTGARLHMAHVSTKEAIEMIEEAKTKGVPVTCEVTPHHISITDVIDYDVHPPLRKICDVKSLVKAIKNGTVDCIATDHAPHSEEDKEKGARGISSIEIAFGICNTFLVKPGQIDLKRLSKLMSFNPSEILGVNKGEIKEGKVADLVLIDQNEAYFVKSEDFVSKGKNTPIEGMKLYGTVKKVFKEGKLVYNSEGGKI